MESLFPIVLSLLCLLLFTFFLISPPSKLPPGPRKLPFIGNLLNLVGALPHRVLQDLSIKHGPLMHLQLGEVPAVVVSSPKMAEVFMRTNDVNFASRPTILMSEIMLYGTKDLIFAPYGEYWRMVRKICTSELLCKRRVLSFRHAREEQYLDLVRWIASHKGTPVNLSKKIFSKSYETTSRIAFGQRCKEHEEFISIIEEVLILSSGFDIGDLFPSYKLLLAISGGSKLKRLHKRADQILVDIIKEHQEKVDKRSHTEVEEDHEDLIDVLLKYEQGADQEFTLTMENVKALILDVFMAGSDTSATTIDWTLAELIKNPEILKRAQHEVRKVFDGEKTVNEEKLSELTFLKMVIKEALRLHPPVPLLVPRETREKCTINGYEIPHKAKVIINAWAISRDPAFWRNGDTFDPDRFQDSSIDFRGSNFEFIPFGAGRRICPGMEFGLASVELVLSLLLYHFDWELPKGVKSENLDMTEWFGATGKRKDSLFLIPTVYQDPPPV